MKTIKAPSVEKLKKYFKISSVQAHTIRNIAKEGHWHLALRMANDRIGGHGVESLYPEAPHISYVNMGDTYSTTILYNEKSGLMWIGTWGDWVEKNLKF